MVCISAIFEYLAGASKTYYTGLTSLVTLHRVGYATNNGIFYMLGDHLGSTSVLLKQNGTVAKQEYYYPFGGNRGTAFSDLTTKRFTGQYHEAGLPGGEGLSYYNARWYDAQLGRFINADTIVPSPGNPQNFNRLSYVRNNPLRFIDPSGHRICEGVGNCAPGSPQSYVPPSQSTANNQIKQQAQTSNSRATVYYLNGLGGRKNIVGRNIPETLNEYVYTLFVLESLYGKDNVYHIPVFTEGFERGWSQLEMVAEAIGISKSQTNKALDFILEYPPLEGHDVILVGSSAGGTIAIELLSLLDEHGIFVNQVILRGSLVIEFSLENVGQVDYLTGDPPTSDHYYSIDVNPYDSVTVQQHIVPGLTTHAPNQTNDPENVLRNIGNLITNILTE